VPSVPKPRARCQPSPHKPPLFRRLATSANILIEPSGLHKPSFHVRTNLPIHLSSAIWPLRRDHLSATLGEPAIEKGPHRQERHHSRCAVHRRRPAESACVRKESIPPRLDRRALSAALQKGHSLRRARLGRLRNYPAIRQHRLQHAPARQPAALRRPCATKTAHADDSANARRTFDPANPDTTRKQSDRQCRKGMIKQRSEQRAALNAAQPSASAPPGKNSRGPDLRHIFSGNQVQKGPHGNCCNFNELSGT